MSSDDISYYRERARVERSRAQDAPSPEIASVHEQLAGLYEALIGAPEQAPANDLAPELPPHRLRQEQPGIQR